MNRDKLEKIIWKFSRTDALVEAASYAIEGLFNLFVDESIESTEEKNKIKEQLGPDI